MATITWSSAYSVGSPTLDADHKHLVDLINGLETAIREGRGVTAAADTIEAVRYYAAEHTRREEEILRAAGYPDLDTQRSEHAAMNGIFDDLERRLANAPTDAGARAVLDALKDWLVKHVLVTDMQFRSYLEEQQVD